MALWGRPPAPGWVEAIVVPRGGKPPEPRQVEHSARRHVASLAPSHDVVFRPEEEHRRSGEADVAPPVTSGHCEVNDPLGVCESSSRDREEQRLSGVRASGGHGAVSADQGQYREGIPDAVPPPVSSARTHAERRRYSGERLGHPNVGATGQENECVGFLLETAEPLLDVGGCELEMGSNLDGARRSACIDEVLVDPQPDLRVADEATLRQVDRISIHSLLMVGRMASRLSLGNDCMNSGVVPILTAFRLMPHNVSQVCSAGSLLPHFLGESDENALGPPDVAEPIRVFVLDHFPNELRTPLAEPGERIVDVLHGEHDA